MKISIIWANYSGRGLSLGKLIYGIGLSTNSPSVLGMEKKIIVVVFDVYILIIEFPMLLFLNVRIYMEVDYSLTLKRQNLQCFFLKIEE